MAASAISGSVLLHNGVELPAVGLGTFRAQGSDVRQAVVWALEAGVRHIDTAAIYKNEAEVGRAVRESGVDRSDVFITSKISPYQQGTAKAQEALQNSLEQLSCGHIDACLIHWPGAARTAPDSPLNAQLRLETWRVLEAAYARGAVRSIGVSNFTEKHLRDICSVAAVRPMINQVELHPRYQQRQLQAVCRELGVAMVAYASLGTGALLGHKAVLAAAAECNKTPAQVLLRWGLEQGCAVISKSVHRERVQRQAPQHLLSWSLPPHVRAALDGLDDGWKCCWNPEDVL